MATTQLPATRSRDEEKDVFPVDLLPESCTPIFLGRDDILSDIDSHLQPAKQPKDKLAIYAMCGVEGIGKTEIAREYAHRNKDKFDAILWVESESKESLSAGFTRIAVELCLPGADLNADPAHNLALVHRWLKDTSSSWLLILDNFSPYPAAKYLPTEAHGSVIATMRDFDLTEESATKFNIRCKTVHKLDSNTAENLFLKLLTTSVEAPGAAIEQLPEPDRKAIQFLLWKIDGLTLGIHYMAAMIEIESQNPQHITCHGGVEPIYTENRHGVVTATFRAKKTEFAGRYVQPLNRKLRQRRRFNDHSIITLGSISLTSLRVFSSSAFILLGILSCVQPDGIPKTLFPPPGTSTLKSDLAFCTDAVEFNKAVAVLETAGLIEVNVHSFSLHRLVQFAFMVQLNSKDCQKIIDSTSSLLQLALPREGDEHLCGEWPKWQKYVKHCAALAFWFKQFTAAGKKVASSPAFVSSILSCGWFLIESGSELDACRLFHDALDAHGSKSDMGEGDLLNGLGMAYFGLNKLSESREYLTKSQSIRESLLEPNSLYLAATFQNMGNLDSAEGKFQSAISNFEKSLSIRETYSKDFPVGTADPDSQRARAERIHQTATATTYLSKARAHLGAKEYELADSSLNTSRSLSEKWQQRENTLELATTYLSGNLQLAIGDYSGAIALYEDALKQIDWIALRNTPRTALEVSCYYKLGTAQFRSCSFEDARNSLSTGLEIATAREDWLGHRARLLWRNAQVIKRQCPDPGEAPWNGPLNFPDSKQIMSDADKIRRQLQGTDYRYKAQKEVLYCDGAAT
ncbi:hypothetical protein O1611_g7569 [Lasiodiplodia mahajangana]|uniref:Uncharacterized protein n=1 Tax=Lasiodiplodia mahajangana TaxID=1108764 RepID=A0ACC2JFR9_9PEZI|nr:hypothetical protein O1611_g7569 [Lasiodiplodia mahajangana]